MASDFNAVRQQDFVEIKLNLSPAGNPLYDYTQSMPCALVWFQTFNAAKPEKPTKHFRRVEAGRIVPGEVDWKAPGALVTVAEALEVCRRHPGQLGLAIALSQGNNLSMLDIDRGNPNPQEYARWMADDYQEPTSNGGMHYYCIGRLGRNMTKPVEFYSGDHLSTVSFLGQGTLKRNETALDYFDSISIQYDVEQFRAVLTTDNRSVQEILDQVRTFEPEKFQRLYMTLHQPHGTTWYDASAMDMALIMSIMDYTRDTNLVYQVFLATGFGQRLINRQPTDKKKGKNYLARSIRLALPRQAMFWIGEDFARANPGIYNDPNFWPSQYGQVEAAPEPETPAPLVTVAEPKGPLYPDLPRGGLFELIQSTMFYGYSVENWHFAKMHALDTVNTLLMPFYMFNSRTRSNMYKIMTGPTSAGKGMVLQSAQYLRLVNEIADETLRGHKQPFLDISGSDGIRQRYVTGPMQGSVRGLDKLYAKATKKRPVLAIKENDFTQSLEAFFMDLASATGPARNVAELGDECTDLYDKSAPGQFLETKATGKTDAIQIAEPMVDITFEGTQEPLLASIAPDGSNLASGRVNRWIFFINDTHYSTRQKRLSEMTFVDIRQVVNTHIAPIMLRLVNMTNNCDDPLNASIDPVIDAYEFECYQRTLLERKAFDMSQGARDVYARIRVNAQKMAMLFAMERHASGRDTQFAIRSEDIDLAYKFILPGYDYIATNFDKGNVGAVDDHDYIVNGAQAIMSELNAFLRSPEYAAWLDNIWAKQPDRATRFHSMHVAPFAPISKKLWTNPIFNSKRIRHNKSAAMNACLEYLQEHNRVLVDRGTNEKNAQHAQLCAANGLRAVGEGLTNATLVKVLK